MKQQKNKRIFIVDDDPFWTTMLNQMLTNLGYTNIFIYLNGTDCIKNLLHNPHLIFLDYQMEGMDGLEVLKKIKSYNSDIAVVFCTEHKELSVAVTAMKNGSFDYMVKSNFTNEELALIIKNMEDKFVFTEKIF